LGSPRFGSGAGAGRRRARHPGGKTELLSWCSRILATLEHGHDREPGGNNAGPSMPGPGRPSPAGNRSPWYRGSGRAPASTSRVSGPASSAERPRSQGVRVGAGAGAGFAPAGVDYRRMKMMSGVTVLVPAGVMHARHLSQAPRAWFSSGRRMARGHWCVSRSVGHTTGRPPRSRSPRSPRACARVSASMATGRWE
jgi:hypothetical protein